MNDPVIIDNGGVACQAQELCAACGSAGTLLHDGLVDAQFGAPGVWSQRRCRNTQCGLSWLDPQPLREEIGKFYAEYWTHSGGATTDDDAPVPRSFDSTGAKKLVKRLLSAFLPWRRAAFQSDRYYLEGLQPGRLLDIGCGNGDFVGAMAHIGWDAHGIDFDPAALAVAERFPGVTTAIGDVFAQDFPAERFEAIMMCNVIEHVPNPVQTVAECHRILKPGGRLVMMTPNLASLGHEVFGKDWRGLEPPRHLFLFDTTSLRRLAVAAGFVRPQLFTTPGGLAASRYMVEHSEANARAAGRIPPAVEPTWLMLKERLLDLAGQPRGEFVILLADK